MNANNNNVLTIGGSAALLTSTGYLDIIGSGRCIQAPQGLLQPKPTGTKKLMFLRMYYEIIVKHMPNSKESDELRDLFDAKSWLVKQGPQAPYSDNDKAKNEYKYKQLAIKLVKKEIQRAVENHPDFIKTVELAGKIRAKACELLKGENVKVVSDCVDTVSVEEIDTRQLFNVNTVLNREYQMILYEDM